MIGMSVFDADAFTATSLTKAVNYMSYVPDFLGSIPGLFEEVPIRTTEVWIERRGYQAQILKTSPRGSPPSRTAGADLRDARAYQTVRLMDASRVHAHELQSIRRFGSEIDLKDLAEEIGRRQFKITANHDITEEWHRFNVVTQGKMLDSDSTTLVDWTAEFPDTTGQPKGARALTTLSEVAFAFSASNDTGSVRQNCNTIVRAIMRNLSGLIGRSKATVVGLCDDTFYDDLVTSAEVRNTFKNWTAAADLRGTVGEVFQPFTYAGIEFVNYRGTDDATTLAVASGKCKFFPRNAGIFQIARAPAEKFEFVNTPGQRRYSWITRDIERDMWADIEVATYPLFACVLPQALASGRAGS